jgi:hypothetical protein
MNILIRLFFLWMFFLFSCDSDLDKQDYIGTYRIDIQSKYLGKIDTSFLYQDLHLKIMSNDSFYFSQDVPFFFSQKGKWELRYIDGIPWAYLQYGKGQFGYLENQVGITKTGELYINNPIPKKGNPSIPQVIFRRVY